MKLVWPGSPNSTELCLGRIVNSLLTNMISVFCITEKFSSWENTPDVSKRGKIGGFDPPPLLRPCLP